MTVLNMGRTESVQLRSGFKAPQSGDPLRELARSIFNRADWGLAAQEAAAVQQLFIRERRSLAFQWLFQIRQRATLMIYRYLIETQRYCPSAMEPMAGRAVRLKVVSHYTLFLGLYAILFLLIQWGNPVGTERMANWTVTILERIASHLPPQTVQLN